MPVMPASSADQVRMRSELSELLEQVNKNSPSCSFSLLAVAISLPTKPEASPA
jgi:hypothetical protein